MNEKQRLKKILRGEKVDRVPCICPGGMMNMITTDLMKTSGIYWPAAHLNPQAMADLALESYTQSCFENVGVPFCMTVESEAMGAQVTMGTDVYEPHISDYAIASVLDWAQVKPLDLNAGRVKVTLDAIRILKEKNLDVPIIGNITGPISTASSVCEPTLFYKQLRKKREDAHAFMTFVTDQLIVFANAMIEAGADIIVIADPSGTGEIMGPALFEEYAVHYLNMLLDGLPKDVETLVHICGNMKKVYREINMVRSNALSFDSMVPMSQARANLPDRVLVGNVSTYALEYGSHDKIATLTRHCIANGANAIAPACGLGTKSPMGNIQTMLTTILADQEV